MLVQMQLSPTLSDQNKTVKYWSQSYKQQCKESALKTGPKLTFQVLNWICWVIHYWWAFLKHLENRSDSQTSE